MEIFDILNLVIGVLCLYWAIVGKGYPYKVNYPKKIRAYSNKLMRITLFLEGPITLFLFAIPQFARNENVPYCDNLSSNRYCAVHNTSLLKIWKGYTCDKQEQPKAKVL